MYGFVVIEVGGMFRKLYPWHTKKSREFSVIYVSTAMVTFKISWGGGI